MHDGPGVRTTVFLKGCPLQCKWCHNPETQKSAHELLFYPNKCIACGACATVCGAGAHIFDGMHRLMRLTCTSCFDCANACPTGALEICGRGMSISDIITEVKKDVAFYGNTGGMTLSGGEPLMHSTSVELLRACRSIGISTAVETCGYADFNIIRAATEFTNLFLWDIKDTDDTRHKEYTGVSNQRILSNLQALDKLGAKTRVRCIIVGGVNTDTEHYEQVAQLVGSLEFCEGVELIPYHAYGGTKSTFLGKDDSGRVEWIPTRTQLDTAREIFKSRGVRVI